MAFDEIGRKEPAIPWANMEVEDVRARLGVVRHRGLALRKLRGVWRITVPIGFRHQPNIRFGCAFSYSSQHPDLHDAGRSRGRSVQPLDRCSCVVRRRYRQYRHRIYSGGQGRNSPRRYQQYALAAYRSTTGSGTQSRPSIIEEQA